ncbi:MAG TPA: secondary thiamine-phosphate synthase enzyme YjbQ [Chitinophagales bacterium]|nr:secondary thiamine-phosphate synthase enzyme YjbQ [Chitinophagales bacterium]HNL85039.1 secondary thiamine-phosphate synthase enzyme YjbQ [Chitinophagales bacterium]
MIKQYSLQLPPFEKGLHLITKQIVLQLQNLPEKGLLHLFILHTSAGLMVNENADPDVRIDMENWFNRTVKENEPYYRHTLEGSDDMPAHIKSALTGNSLTIPIVNHKLHLGTWQGIYLCEFRNHGGSRNIMATVIG